VLQAPSAVAMNGEGDLYIADFDMGQVIVVPTRTGKAASIVDTGLILQHPISLALDYLGNLYIGDAGSDGTEATSSNPGYVVKVLQNGSVQRVATPGVPIVFPQALATSEIDATLYIGDGGDAATSIGQVVSVSANSGAAAVIPFAGQTAPTDPTGLAVDAAGDLYVLDGNAKTITVAPLSGNSHLVSFDNTSLSAPSAFANSAGGQSFVIANIGNGTSNSLIYLNGNSSLLAFGNVKVNNNSTGNFKLYNIGNATMKLSNTPYTLTQSPTVFTTLAAFDCTARVNVLSAASCNGSMQFRPTALRSYTGQLSFSSNAYNTGIPILNLSGTGTATGLASFPERDRRDGVQAEAHMGRKSFHKLAARPRVEQ
jgi:hypothetical protein